MNTKQNNLIPQLRFPEFQGEWKIKKIENILSIGSGKDYKHLKDGEIPVYGTGGYMTSVNEFLYDGESVCIGRKGTIDNPIFLNEKFWTVDTLFYTHSFKQVLPRFVYSLFQNINWYKHNEASGVPSLSKKTIEKININLPTLPEQKKIASFLTDVDDKITKLTKKKDLLEQYKKGIMQKIFSLELRFKDDNGNEFPKWEKTVLGKISNITTGSSNRQDSGLNGEFTFFDRSEDIRTSSRYLFEGEAVIVAGEGSDFVPKYYVGKFDLHQRTYAIMEFKESISKFIYFYIHFHRRYFLSQAVGSTVKSLRLPMFQKMPIKLPVKEEQTKIANFLSDIDIKIEALNTQIENSKAFKKGLLQQMFV
ncbi:restriction endonuclease subunit S [Aureibaculum marinum]|uniref:Restriction endonuclease subunit S n=1 Tax=Aureibaculum marinum TaxID=2487930 RepID=A0A3N4NSW3_9FLAO|nr:restriction endonuclease subunit S [Aureibaculum marinum]RPD96166.1 restriction endonuclease subunit S [Aureibaculum marinum]